MNSQIRDLIIKATGAQTAYQLEVVQRLWSGYCDIVRYGLTGGDRSTVIVKHVKPRRSDGYVTNPVHSYWVGDKLKMLYDNQQQNPTAIG